VLDSESADLSPIRYTALAFRAMSDDKSKGAQMTPNVHAPFCAITQRSQRANTPFCTKTQKVKTRNEVNLTSDKYVGQDGILRPIGNRPFSTLHSLASQGIQ